MLTFHSCSATFRLILPRSTLDRKLASTDTATKSTTGDILHGQIWKLPQADKLLD